jgi:hypothetical protein
MTEQDWLACQEPQRMLALLRGSGKVSERKRRLFAIAVCRRIWHFLTDERSRRAVEVAELLADGRIDRETRSATRRAASHAIARTWRMVRRTSGSRRDTFPPTDAARVATYVLDVRLTEATIAFLVARAVGAAAEEVALTSEAESEERKAQAALLRDIFGNPFRAQPTLAATVLAWDDGCIVKLASGIYQEQDFSPERMGVLADALEEAGVTNEEVLGHLRGPGVHVRGCHVVDLLTGRE